MEISTIFLEIDAELVKAVHRHHVAWLDGLLKFWSYKWSWLPLYGLIVFFLMRRLGQQEGLLFLLFLGLGIAASDQISSALIKPLCERLRPCHDPQILPFLQLPDGCGGKFGFVSSHAANSLCLLLLLHFRFNLSLAWLISGGIWVFLTGFSRVYLGAHYPGDILGGWMVGWFVAFLFYRLFHWSKYHLPYFFGQRSN